MARMEYIRPTESDAPAPKSATNYTSVKDAATQHGILANGTYKVDDNGDVTMVIDFQNDRIQGIAPFIMND